MTDHPYVTAVEAELGRRRRRWRPVLWLAALLAIVSLLVVIGAVVLGATLLVHSTPGYDDPVEHFKYGSIGSEPKSGLPYKLWKVLPRLFPEWFEGRDDYAAFGFLYETVDGARRDLPIGIAKRRYRGVDLVWFNCAVCHTGTYRQSPNDVAHIVPGMPSNNLDLNRFIDFVLATASDERLAPDSVFAAMAASGEPLGPIEKLMWRFVVLPSVREGLIQRQSRLVPLLAEQPPWGPGRVDTFNPYKVVQMNIPAAELNPEEIVGASDFPSIFLQGPREGMQLHWDGNNPSLNERNLSAAIGAGVTPETVDHAAIERVADWLMTLPPPPSPHQADEAAAARGKQIYGEICASCHGYADGDAYVFEGERLGQVEGIGRIATDPGRLNSYTEAFRARQLDELFAGTPYQFKHFTKTNGYANMPLDGLWLRAPYLHNGSVPTLADLLKPPAEREPAFVRGIDTLDPEHGGFAAPACDPQTPVAGGVCFDTRLPGNGNQGHGYGIDLTELEKADLMAYLLRF